MSLLLFAIATLGAAVPALLGREIPSLVLPIPLPLGRVAIGLDPLSAFFLIPLAVLGAMAALYMAALGWIAWMSWMAS